MDIHLSDWLKNLINRNRKEYHIDIRYLFDFGGITFINLKYRTALNKKSVFTFISYNRGSSFMPIQIIKKDLAKCRWV